MEDPNTKPPVADFNNPTDPLTSNNNPVVSDNATDPTAAAPLSDPVADPVADDMAKAASDVAMAEAQSAELSEPSDPTNDTPESADVNEPSAETAEPVADFTKPAVDTTNFGTGTSIDGVSAPKSTFDNVDQGYGADAYNKDVQTPSGSDATAAPVAAAATGTVAVESKAQGINGMVIWIAVGVVAALAVGVAVYFIFFR